MKINIVTVLFTIKIPWNLITVLTFIYIVYCKNTSIVCIYISLIKKNLHFRLRFWCHSYTPYQLSHILFIFWVLLNQLRQNQIKKTIRARQIGGGGVGGMAHIRWCVLVFNLISLLWYWTDLMVVQHFELWITPVV